MVECPLDPMYPSSGQGSNTNSLSSTRNSEVGYSSPPRPKQEISYHHIRSVRPITRQFAKAVGLIPGVHNLPSSQRKQKTIPTRVVVSSVEEVILATLEELAEVVENEEEPLVFLQGEEIKNTLLGSGSGGSSRRCGG